MLVSTASFIRQTIQHSPHILDDDLIVQTLTLFPSLYIFKLTSWLALKEVDNTNSSEVARI